MVAASVRASPPVCQDWRLADFLFMFKMVAAALSIALSCKAGRRRQAAYLSQQILTCVSLARTVSPDLPWLLGRLRQRALTFPIFIIEGNQGEVSQEPVLSAFCVITC